MKIIKSPYIIITVIAIIGLIFFLLSNGEEEISFISVERGDLAQEVFETGSTEKGEDVRVSFKEGGRITSLLVKEGESIERGDLIAEIDRRDLQISLREAQAALSSANANLEKLLEGASVEELDVVDSAVRSAQVALDLAEENKREQEKVTNEMLRSAHQNTNTLLGEINTTTNMIKRGVDDLTNKHFTRFVTEETREGRRIRDVIRRSAREIENYKDLAEGASFEDKTKALREVESNLKTIISELDNLIDVIESDFYEDRISQTEADIIRGYRSHPTSRSNATTALAEVTSLLGSISSVNAEVDAKLTAARGNVNSAESALNQAKSELSRAKADPRSSDIQNARGVVDQARARVELFESRITDTYLRSPVSGIISASLAREGEVVSLGSPVAVIVPDEDIQVGIDIYEGDIAKINEGDKVEATFVAFPGEKFDGEVVFINPVGKIVDGVVYFEVKIILDDYPENTLPQMTVDIVIETGRRENVLIVPERSVITRDGKSIVRVYDNGDIVEKEVVVGLRGEGRMVEVVSGLEEGDKIVN